MITFVTRDLRAQTIFFTSVKKLRRKSIGINVFKRWIFEKVIFSRKKLMPFENWGIVWRFGVVFCEQYQLFWSKIDFSKNPPFKNGYTCVVLADFFYRSEKDFLSSDISRDKRLHVDAKLTSVWNTVSGTHPTDGMLVRNWIWGKWPVSGLWVLGIFILWPGSTRGTHVSV